MTSTPAHDGIPAHDGTPAHDGDGAIGHDRRAGEAAPGAVARFVAVRAPGAPITIALIALTRFEIVNAAFGRMAGDALLLAAVERIAAALPPAAAVERIEGASFAVAMALPADEADRVLSEIDAALARAFTVEGADANLGVRLGAAHRTRNEGQHALWRRAADALDSARRADGVRIAVADEPREASAARLAADLHRAIDRREIDILFQPQVSLADNTIVGVEALARWEHPEHGVLGAETLFAAAARADLGLALSEHIQALAAGRAAAWTDARATLRVSLNVTATEVTRAGFAERFAARLDAAALARERVTVEITETELIADLPIAAAQLAWLRAAGIRIAIDDFGTGHSSLAYLGALPLDYIKIDRRLTQDIDGNPRDRIVVRGVIAIARELGIATIVEGVESEAQRALLAAEGCALYQGFLCAGPLDEAGLRGLLEAS